MVNLFDLQAAQQHEEESALMTPCEEDEEIVMVGANANKRARKFVQVKKTSSATSTIGRLFKHYCLGDQEDLHNHNPECMDKL